MRLLLTRAKLTKEKIEIITSRPERFGSTKKSKLLFYFASNSKQ
jgi:hypothetical protein